MLLIISTLLHIFIFCFTCCCCCLCLWFLLMSNCVCQFILHPVRVYIFLFYRVCVCVCKKTVKPNKAWWQQHNGRIIIMITIVCFYCTLTKMDANEFSFSLCFPFVVILFCSILISFVSFDVNWCVIKMINDSNES